MLIKKCLFTILLILGVDKILEKQVAAEKGHIDIDYKGIDFYTLSYICAGG